MTKALVEVAGMAMAERVAAALIAGGCEPVVLIGGDAVELAPLRRPVIADRWPGEGPLGGVLCALGALESAGHVIVAACDLPHVDGATVARLARADPAADVIVARGARRHPTLARWSMSVAPTLRASFDGGERSLLGALAALEAADHRVVELPVDEDRLRNVNAPDLLG